MRLALVMCSANRSMRGGTREIALCRALAEAGIEARIWRMHAGEQVEEEPETGVPVTYCPADDPALKRPAMVSAALRRSLAAWRPDFVLYKGLGYRVAADTQAALGETRHGFIVGGSVRDAILDSAALVLAEYEEQLARHFPRHLAEGGAMVLPKWVDWTLAGDGTPAEAPDFDIVNVGTFADERKNQAALLPFAAKRRIALVGGGKRLPALREAVRAARHAGQVRFFGHVEHARVFEVLRRSRLMVHTSRGDGLPRAAIEAMACGLPVIAFRDTLPGGIPPEAGLLVGEAGLPHAVRLLLEDETLRRVMGAAARRHVERHHGEAAIAEAAQRLAAMLRAL
ncbi:glycosyltransferase family 4 protein [Falsiroseomonas sp. HW251]|uniref:glycosyltransferase family 4 protein n=1 Tax=Falsiroseomonas sp. HW251 TaxID=3390998 RepID=UPI003D3154AE